MAVLPAGIRSSLGKPGSGPESASRDTDPERHHSRTVGDIIWESVSGFIPECGLHPEAADQTSRVV
jgi:hypothetical protein